MKFAKNKLYQIAGMILLTGETGCGKSKLAKDIHERSERSKNPFVVANLAVLSESLLESELFGHTRGAFTGAIGDKKGLCDLVGKGTLFLDEVGELSLGAQKKLLYLLEERKFLPVGSCHEKKFNGRVIAATNKNLRQMVVEKSFREDLYYRLRVFEYRIPPLREDKERLENIFTNVLKRKGITNDHKDWCDLRSALLNYAWPGNIRELLNAIDYYCALNELPDWVFGKKSYTQGPIGAEGTYVEELELFERDFFKKAMRRNMGAINKTAQKIQISKTTLLTKLKKYGIDYREFKYLDRSFEDGRVA